MILSVMKKYIAVTVWIAFFGVGIFLLLYPCVSNYWNVRHQSEVIINYTDAVAAIDNDTYSALWTSAKDYNARLAESGDIGALSRSLQQEYNQQLNVTGNGLMGYIEIPSIDCYLPIYHGTDEAVLQVAVGHLEGSSLPVGGSSTHCVLSGHRGLPSAKLFSDLDKMAVGDVFILHTLDELLMYEVDQILTVLPTELDALNIEKDEDFCTLVTCTPYGINSHRLLVRGHRIENVIIDASDKMQERQNQTDIVPVVLLIAGGISLIFLAALMVGTRQYGRRRKH